MRSLLLKGWNLVMTKKENLFRRGQRLKRDISRSAIKNVSEKIIAPHIAPNLQKFAEALDNDTVKKVGKSVSSSVSKSTAYIKKTAVKLDEQTGFTNKIQDETNEKIIAPTKKILMETGVGDAIHTAGENLEKTYGKSRELYKPYFEAESARELLESTHNELTYVTACILQTSVKDAEGFMSDFGRLASVKIMGAAGAGSLFSLVSTFGAAGTGTAISTLSGAAANSATLAWLGAGSMASGALVLSGVGVAVGMVAYKLFSSTARDIETLPREEKQIIETAGLLAAAIKSELDKDEVSLTAEEAIQFKTQGLNDFYNFLKINSNIICKRLDKKNSIAFRQHVLVDFKTVVLNGFETYAAKAPFSVNGVIGGVFLGLMSLTDINYTHEQELVLDALRRSTNSLHDATEEEISIYLNTLASSQLQGLANNVKGIYHELLHVENYNNNHEDSYAEVFTSTTHQGSDVMIKSSKTDEIFEEYQLKATNSTSYVKEHQSRYENIPVKATDEVAEKNDDVETSGLSNAEITFETKFVLNGMADNTTLNQVVEATEVSALIVSGIQAFKLLQGQITPSKSIGTIATVAATSGLTAFLFS